MNTPTVSIIIPAYNLSKNVEKCLYSVIHQTFNNIEIIIVDDGSTDDTNKILCSFANNDSRIKVIRQENKGTAVARNVGIQASKGEYISFVDGDDWIEPTMIEEMLELISNADVLSTDCIQDRGNNQIVRMQDDYSEGIYSNEKLEYFFSRMICDNDNLPTLRTSLCNKLFRKELFDKIDISITEGVKWGEDIILLYAYLIKCSSIKIIHKSFYHYQYRRNSASHTVDDMYILDKVGLLYRRLYYLLKDTPAEYRLVEQLQKFIIRSIQISLFKNMNFQPHIIYPIYTMNFDCVNNSKIVLYGAGNVGISYYKLLTQGNWNTEIICFMDKNYKKYENSSFSVESPEKINELQFDYILIAVFYEDTANQIRDELISKVAPKKIIWKKPQFLI